MVRRSGESRRALSEPQARRGGLRPSNFWTPSIGPTSSS